MNESVSKACLTDKSFTKVKQALNVEINPGVGDVNADGEIDALDYALVKMFLLNSITVFQ